MGIAIHNRIGMYAAAIGLVLAIWLELPGWFRPRVYSVPSSKSAQYLSQKDKIGVLFVGDSRTFTDIQPRVVDPLTGRRSYNLASFGLWMPVQYLEFRDVFPHVPRNTVIVWSLSHHNFTPIGDRWWIPGQYAFGLKDVAEYIVDGYPAHRIIQEFEEAPFSPFDLTVKARKKMVASLNQVLWRAGSPSVGQPPAVKDPPPGDAALPAETYRAMAQSLMQRLAHDSGVTQVAPVEVDGNVRSVEASRSDGGYDRIIIDRAFFRQRQAKLWPRRGDDGAGCHFEANDVYMTTFRRILDLVSVNRLRMIVNYIEDAPGSWPSDTERRCAKEFMVNKIVPILTQRGIKFTTPDFYPAIAFSNDFYFDESHLNTEGAAIYSRLLAAEITKVLTREGW